MDTRASWRAEHHQRRARSWDQPDVFAPGDVVICTKDAGRHLKRGVLYRVREKVAGNHAYWLEGISDVGFWSSRLERAPGLFTRAGLIRRVLPLPTTTSQE